jgi:hypothetical protein
MTIRKRHVSVFAPAAALLLAVSLTAAPSASPPGTWNYTTEASKLLDRAQSLSAALKADAVRLESLTRSHVTWQTHAHHLNLVRQHVNEIGPILTRLQEIRHVLTPWQQQATDRVVPLASVLAARTEAAINHLNEYQRYLYAADYKGHLGAIADHARSMNQHIGMFIDYAETGEKLEQLRLDLELPRS